MIPQSPGRAFEIHVLASDSGSSFSITDALGRWGQELTFNTERKINYFLHVESRRLVWFIKHQVGQQDEQNNLDLND